MGWRIWYLRWILYIILWSGTAMWLKKRKSLSVGFSRKDVSWIKSAGIAQHPEWYPGTCGMNYFQCWANFDILLEVASVCGPDIRSIFDFQSKSVGYSQTFPAFSYHIVTWRIEFLVSTLGLSKHRSEIWFYGSLFLFCGVERRGLGCHLGVDCSMALWPIYKRHLGSKDRIIYLRSTWNILRLLW